MAIRPNDEVRSFGADREKQREISNESARLARPSNGESAGRGDSMPESGSTQQRGRSNRGFASMDRSKQREIASKGGRAAHQKGTAHEFDSGEARAAGRKGGVTVSKNREHMAAIGRRGGEARGANRAARLQQSDREVGLSGNGATHSNGNGSSPRVSGNSLGGEMRNAGAPERNVERP